MLFAVFHGDMSRMVGDTFRRFMHLGDDVTPGETFRDVSLWEKLNETHGQKFRSVVNLLGVRHKTPNLMDVSHEILKLR